MCVYICTLCLVYLGRFVRIEASGPTAAVLWVAASSICSKEPVAFLLQSVCYSSGGATVYYYLLGHCRKSSCFILSVKSDFNIIDGFSIALHAFLVRLSASISVDEILLPRYVN